MKNKCNHLIGYTEREGYDCMETNFVYADHNDVKELKSMPKDNYFKFCSNCGESLAGVVSARISELESAIKEQKEQEQKKREEQNNIFNAKVEQYSQESKLGQLDDIDYIIRFEPLKSSYGEDYVLHGQKNAILRHIVSHNERASQPENFVVKSIHKVLTTEQMTKIMESCGYETKGSNENIGYSKVDGNKTIRLSSYSGMVYVNVEIVDSESKDKYDRFLMTDLPKFLNIPIDFEEVKLK